MEPRIFKFGTPYSEMYHSLAATPEDEAFFLHNGVLQLCKRGASVKVGIYMYTHTCTLSESLKSFFFKQTKIENDHNVSLSQLTAC